MWRSEGPPRTEPPIQSSPAQKKRAAPTGQPHGTDSNYWMVFVATFEKSLSAPLELSAVTTKK